MTILNQASDGLHSQLIALARAAAKNGPTPKDELLAMCALPTTEEGSDVVISRLRTTLNRWTQLGLFVDEDSGVKLTLETRRGESSDDFSDRLPAVCRSLVLRAENCMPTWAPSDEKTEDGAGRSADFVRGIAWSLMQDIYTLPSATDEIEALEASQIESPKFVFFNKTRWPGFRFWGRFLGFATGNEDTFLLDPTEAVRTELMEILDEKQPMPADLFVDALAKRLPVIDRGEYRRQVEGALRASALRRLPDNHLSMSLSFALRRLSLDGVIALENKADAGASLALTGRDYRTWDRFTHVRLVGESQ
ncbi:protein DpdG [Caballeronia sp. LjRoot34]|uniref:protein DpdG n=1 Tax=Caballeronia sp. LjRoot34 TaxID=3342325 RepID=UPI003ECE53FB